MSLAGGEYENSDINLSLIKRQSATQILKDSFEVVFDSKPLGPDAENRQGLTTEHVELRTLVVKL